MLAWLIPGLGHIVLGHKTRGIICLVAVTLTYWTGVAIGGVGVVDSKRPPRFSTAHSQEYYEGTPRAVQSRSWWFFGQIMAGGYTLGAMTVSRYVDSHSPTGTPRYLAWPSGDIAAVYTGVAGLLNLLIIMDAWARCMGLEGVDRRRGPPGLEARGSG
jgi:hypothetical protein